MASAGSPSRTVRLDDVDANDAERIAVPGRELNRVLGGGFVRGSIVLLSGDPGIGKSTLALQTAAAFRAPLYVAGEESPSQIKMRAERIGLNGSGIVLTTSSSIEGIMKDMEKSRPDFLIVDSIQTIQVEALGAAAGPVNQIRESAAQLQRLSKRTGVPSLVIGHVTKSGDVAGPMLLEHLVDTVLLLEQDVSGGYRMLRGLKNRFGATDETGLFVMTEKGMIDMTDPSEILLPTRGESRPGSAAVATMEGRRPLVLELQALTVPTSFGLPRRVATGLDTNRLAMLLAVLERHGGIASGKDDVYLNSAGGFRVRETAADLGVIAALASAERDRALPPRSLFVGEVGLSGETRPVPRVEIRLKEAASLGFTTAFVPEQKIEQSSGLEIVAVKHIEEMICRALS